MNNNTDLSGFLGDVSNVRLVETRHEADALLNVRPAADMDLVAMARWCQRALRLNPRPKLDYECRFSMVPSWYPPCPGPEDHDPITIGDTDCRMDWEFGYMREMTGDTAADEVGRGVRKRVLGYLRDDGNCWVTVRASSTMPGIWAVSWTTGELLVSLSEEFRRTGDERLRPLCRKMFEALRRRADWVEGRAFYAGGNGWWDEEGWAVSDCTPYHPAMPLLGVTHYYEAFREPEALAFAVAFAEGEMANDQWRHGLLRDPSKLTPRQQRQRTEFSGIPEFPETSRDLDLGVRPDGSFDAHSHMRTRQGWGMAHLASITREPRLVAWCKRLLDFVLSRGTAYGWMPEGIGSTVGSETCVVGDVISMAEKLAKCGYPEYWDVVERAVRNYIREAQFFFSPEYEEMYRRLHPGEEGEKGLTMARNLEGGFQGRMGLTERIHYQYDMDMMGCCVPEGMRSLHVAWKNTVTDEADGIHVNMGFDRDAPEAKVASFLPTRGGMEVTAKVARDFWLRPPAWAPRERVRLQRAGATVAPDWRGAYLFVGSVKACEKLTLTYPLVAFTQEQTLNHFTDKIERTVTVNWLGNTVVGIEPKGEKLPLFETVPRPLPPLPRA
ncbi:MAG: hypothetical protein PHR35_02315 [Kiritimatiellae bacterium]|nr:hypothetical protein [Kiritimatiellia bacterium]